MKKLLPLGLLIFLFTSCDRCFIGCDECEDVVCYNNGFCVDGSCDCTQWYTGGDCSIAVLEQYEGTYAGTYTCSFAYPYVFTFGLVDNAPNLMIVEDMSAWSINREYEVQFTDDKNFLIPDQVVNGYNNEILRAEGDGVFSSTGLSMTIQFTNVTAGTSSSSCVFLEI